MTVSPERFNPGTNDVLAMVDVDHYVDMPSFLGSNFKPILMYTFQPTSVSRCAGEYKYTFNSANEVNYSVSGGAVYTHSVWNYNVDNLKITNRFFGIPWRVTTYHVDRRMVDKDHNLILISPDNKWVGLSVMLASFLEGCNLVRLKVVQGDYLRLLVNSKTELVVSTGKVDKYLSIDVPITADEYIESVAKTCKVGLMFAQVKSKIGVDQDGAAILYEYHLSKINKMPTMVYPLDPYVRGYQFQLHEYDPEAKRSLTSYMRPIIDGAFAPDMTKANEKQAVFGRITSVRSTTAECLIDQFFLRVVDEFVGLFLEAVEGTLHPVDYEIVYEKQNRPTQRMILHQSEYMNPHRLNKGFMKREAYGKCTDPRIISTVNGVDKMNYSCYIYALSAVLKTKEWYAFAKTPLEISIRIAEISRHAKTMNNTDFSRWDGHVSEALRYLEKQVMMRAFREEYRENLWEVQQTQMGLPCVMSLGTKFEGKFERLSGSAETSDFNSIDDAFIAYYAWRMSRDSSGHYYSPEMAYDMLGMYGGDDGVTPDLDPTIYKRAASKMGQNLTIDTINRGEFGVTFLSRQYGPDIWYGDLSSMCDLKRTLSKFHTTINLPSNITPEMKLQDKAFAYSLSDLNTPVIGDFVRAVVQHTPADYVFHNYSGVWNATYVDMETQYPNVYGEWMLFYTSKSLENFDIKKFQTWVEQPLSISDLLNPPLCMPRIEATSSVEVVVDGDVVRPTTKSTYSVEKKRARGERKRNASQPPRDLKRTLRQ
jgi:hypothetical protein